MSPIRECAVFYQPVRPHWGPIVWHVSAETHWDCCVCLNFQYYIHVVNQNSNKSSAADDEKLNDMFQTFLHFRPFNVKSSWSCYSCSADFHRQDNTARYPRGTNPRWSNLKVQPVPTGPHRPSTSLQCPRRSETFGQQTSTCSCHHHANGSNTVSVWQAASQVPFLKDGNQKYDQWKLTGVIFYLTLLVLFKL